MVNEPPDRHALVLVTSPADTAPALAKTLVEERLAACANLMPVRSIYRWEGSIADNLLFSRARGSFDLQIPQDKYYLADAGFAAESGLLVP